MYETLLILYKNENQDVKICFEKMRGNGSK